MRKSQNYLQPGDAGSAGMSFRTLARHFLSLLRTTMIGTVVAIMAGGVAEAADLRGTITYRTSAATPPSAMANALVTFYQPDTKRTTVTRTNSVGGYSLKDLQSGLYVLFVEKDGRKVYQGKILIPVSGNIFDIAL